MFCLSRNPQNERNDQSGFMLVKSCGTEVPFERIHGRSLIAFLFRNKFVQLSIADPGLSLLLVLVN